MDEGLDYVIIRSGEDDLLTVLKLTQWSSWKWDKFSIVKETETKEIKWFESEEEAKDFMLENFPKEMINPEYLKDTSHDGKYYID